MVRSGAEVSFCAISTLVAGQAMATRMIAGTTRSEEHTSELQSRLHLVCRLLLEKKNMNNSIIRESVVTDPTRAALIQIIADRFTVAVSTTSATSVSTARSSLVGVDASH